MSAKVCGLIWEVGPQDRSQRFVLLAIGDNAGDDGYAYPGIALISKKTLFSERYVMDAIQRLENEGWVRVERRAEEGKGNHYYIDIERLEDLKSELRSREKSSREPASREKQDKTQVKSNADSGEIQRKIYKEEPLRTVIEPSLPGSEDARIFCEEIGIFPIRQQEEIFRCYVAFAKREHVGAIEAREHMKKRWREYEARMPTLEWAFASAYKFFMSSIWDSPEMWQPKKTSQDQMSKMKFAN